MTAAFAIRAPYGRRAVRPNANRVQTAQNAKLPPPVGGWDTQSPLASMKPDRAVRLDNFIPRQGYIELRKGYATHATGIGAKVGTLVVWRGPTSQKMFAIRDNAIYDVSEPGPVEAPVATGLTESNWQFVNFGTPGGQFIRGVAPGQTPIVFNGTNWSLNPAITGSGLTVANLGNVFAHKERLYFTEYNSSKFWFLDPIAIGGAAAVFDLATIFTKGGALVAGATWSIDGGAGPDDLAVFASSQGQIAIYQGIDPGSAQDWQLVGLYDLPRPVGPRCFIKLGGDLGYLSESGILPLSAVLVGVNISNNPKAISARVNGAFLASSRAFGVDNRWQPITYDRESLLIINVPRTNSGLTQQYVMNMTTGGWCRWLGINAQCWATFNGLLYFGSIADGTVNLADTGHQDGTSPIVGDALGAFSDYGASGRFKHFNMLRPILRAPRTAEPTVEMVTNFEETVPDSAPVRVDDAGGWETALWGEALWGEARWGRSSSMSLLESGAKGLGIYGAPRLRCATNDASTSVTSTTSVSALELHGYDVTYQTGGIL